jgi:hypothetical protein
MLAEAVFFRLHVGTHSAGSRGPREQIRGRACLIQNSLARFVRRVCRCRPSSCQSGQICRSTPRLRQGHSRLACMIMSSLNQNGTMGDTPHKARVTLQWVSLDVNVTYYPTVSQSVVCLWYRLNAECLRIVPIIVREMHEDVSPLQVFLAYNIRLQLSHHLFSLA